MESINDKITKNNSSTSLKYEEKLKIEGNNNQSIVIFKRSSIFFEILNHSAYLFYFLVSKYQVKVENIKKLNNVTIYKIGFPDKALPKINEILNKIDGIKVKDETSHIVYSLPDNILPKDIKPYEEWTKEMEQLHKGREQNKKNVAKPHSSDPIYDLILNIDYSTLTPVKAMNIISELQNEVKKVLNNSN